MGVRTTAIAGIFLLALAGAAFAASSWHAWGWQGIWNGTNRATHMNESNGTWNSSHSGMGFRQNANGTRNASPPMPNGSWAESPPMHMAGNYSQFNSTELSQFNAAVASGDYATAESLHNEYGFGGQMFEKLNGTTFAQYSQIYNLQNQLKNLAGTLRQELGFNASEQHMAEGAAGARGFAGFRAMAGRSGLGARGMMH